MIISRIAGIRRSALLILLWLTVITFFSSIPGSGYPVEPPLWYVLERKFAHLFEFAVLAVLVVRLLEQLCQHKHSRLVYSSAVLFVFAAGALDELHQAFVFGRGSRVTDVAIDVAGGVIGLAVLAFFRTKRERRGLRIW